jgi:hypothetical protein
MKLICVMLWIVGPVAAIAEEPIPPALVRITTDRIAMNPKVATLCAPSRMIVGPHDTPTVHLYVNQAVIDYRKQHPDAHHYPVGSVFFKEKYSAEGKAILATVMTKIADTNRVEDWRYEMIKLPSKAPTKIDAASCQDCHERYQGRGFISQTTEDALTKFLNQAAEIPGTPDKPESKN